ncbi:hypothetical protein pb186bvf_000407 [Paramecium bursaria]
MTLNYSNLLLIERNNFQKLKQLSSLEKLQQRIRAQNIIQNFFR